MPTLDFLSGIFAAATRWLVLGLVRPDWGDAIRLEAIEGEDRGDLSPVATVSSPNSTASLKPQLPH